MDLNFVLLSLWHVVLSSAWPALHFTSSRTFHITVFQDLHFGEGENTEWGPFHDEETLKLMEYVLKVESPQLVVLNGDLITGENVFIANATAYMDKIASPLVQAGLPWASTYGSEWAVGITVSLTFTDNPTRPDHDSDLHLTRRDIYVREKMYPNSLTGSEVNQNHSGVSNYYVPVYPNDSSTVPAMILWFFDSRGGYVHRSSLSM